MAMERKTKAATESLVLVLIIALILVGVNALSALGIYTKKDLTKSERYTLRIEERPAPSQHHGAVHPADAGEDREGMLLRPLRGRVRPFGGPGQSPNFPRRDVASSSGWCTF